MQPITVDPDSDTPPYEQVREQLAAAVRSGALPAGHRLPTVRQLAADLSLATNTVARAYKELEQAGVVQTRGRAGTFVEDSGDAMQRAGAASAREFVQRAHDLGADDATTLAWVRAALLAART